MIVPNYPNIKTWNIESNYMSVTIPQQTGSAIIGTNELINLSGYTKIMVECEHSEKTVTYEIPINNNSIGYISFG